ncbi:MAG: penicillin-binding protein activator [Alphaproteobacteria bacterium]|nr:penicillin-binding protein activator [Alphaproteobacteria bacterium]
MVASKFVKECKTLWLVSAFSLLAACGPETPAPVRQAPTPVRVEAEISQQTNEVAPVQSAVVAPDSGPIRIAIMLPLSGAEEPTGRALLNAATMALFDAYDSRLKLIPFDTKADGLTTESVAHEALAQEVDIVLGPLLAGNVQIAGEIFGPAGVPVIGFSNDSRVAGEGRYILGFMPENEVSRVVDFAITKGHEKFSALVPEGLYGARVRNAFGDAVGEEGARVVAMESYPPDPEAVFEPVKALARYDQRRKDYQDEIRYLRSLRDDLTDEIADELAKVEKLEPVEFDAVLVPEGGALLRTVGPLLPFYEIDPNQVQLLGTGLWNDKSLTREPPLHGAWFAAPEPEAPDAFMVRYAEMFGEEPPRLATIAYDGMSLIAALARDTLEEGETRFSSARLTASTGFVGVDGLFRLNPDGLNERALAILEITRRGFNIVDPAPEAFPSFGFNLRQSASRE